MQFPKQLLDWNKDTVTTEWEADRGGALLNGNIRKSSKSIRLCPTILLRILQLFFYSQHFKVHHQVRRRSGKEGEEGKEGEGRGGRRGGREGGEEGGLGQAVPHPRSGKRIGR